MNNNKEYEFSNEVCTGRGCKIEGGCCNCFISKQESEVKRVTIEYMDGTKKEMIQGYVLTITEEGKLRLMNFNI